MPLHTPLLQHLAVKLAHYVSGRDNAYSEDLPSETMDAIEFSRPKSGLACPMRLLPFAVMVRV